jgi:DnaK suppressor protein
MRISAQGRQMATTAKKTATKKTIEKEVVELEVVAPTKAKKPTAKSSEKQSLVVITEDQLIKMSDKDYMNADQLAFFKDRLKKLKDDILKNADATTENLRENILVPDPVDRATIEEEHALELRTRDRERKLLKKVEQALGRIESGDYGWCEETGEPIGVSRLLARPTANLSLEAQERRELRQKLFGD